MSRHALFIAYNLEQPSFRYRMRCLIPALEGQGWTVRVEQFPSGRYGWRVWERRALLAWADITVLQQVKLSAPEAWWLRRYARRALLDIDDAIYVRKPRQLGLPAEESAWRRAKFRATCSHMDAVVVGNDVLAQEARRAGRPITILPTAVDADRYELSQPAPDQPPTVVWIGSPENLVYLELVRPALVKLKARLTNLRLRVVCSRFPDWPELNIERVAWSSSAEIAALRSAHVGIMPLTDDAWARGKCAFKLLQYMAAGLPCVASPVGANVQAVVPGVTGFLADGTPQWEQALGLLLSEPQKALSMGRAGLAHLNFAYAQSTYINRYSALLTEWADKDTP